MAPSSACPPGTHRSARLPRSSGDASHSGLELLVALVAPPHFAVDELNSEEALRFLIDDSEHDQLVKNSFRKKVSEFYQES
jgi:hypothetical protein